MVVIFLCFCFGFRHEVALLSSPLHKHQYLFQRAPRRTRICVRDTPLDSDTLIKEWLCYYVPRLADHLTHHFIRPREKGDYILKYFIWKWLDGALLFLILLLDVIFLLIIPVNIVFLVLLVNIIFLCREKDSCRTYYLIKCTTKGITRSILLKILKRGKEEYKLIILIIGNYNICRAMTTPCFLW